MIPAKLIVANLVMAGVATGAVGAATAPSSFA